MPSGDRHRTQSQYQDSYDDAGAAEEGDEGRSGAPGAPPGEEGPAQPRSGEQDRPRSAFPNSGGYPGAGGDRPAMAEPYPSALGDLGLPGDPRSAGGSPASGQDPPPLTRPYAAPPEDAERRGTEGWGGRPAAGSDDDPSGTGFDDPGRGLAGAAGGSAFPPRPGYGEAGDPPSGADYGSGGTVAGYRLPETPATGGENAPLTSAGGAGGYPDFDSTVRSEPGAGAADSAPGAARREPSAGAPQGHGGTEWGAAGAAPYGSGSLGPDTEPLPSGEGPEAEGQPRQAHRSGEADRSASGGPAAGWSGPGTGAGPGDPAAEGDAGYGRAYPGTGEPFAGAGPAPPGAWESLGTRPRPESGWQGPADPVPENTGWDAGRQPPGTYENSATDRPAGAPWSGDPAAGTGGSSAHADHRAPLGGSEEPRWAPSGEDRTGPGERAFDHGIDSTAGEPRRYASESGHRLDPEPGPLPRWEPGGGDPLDAPPSRPVGAEPSGPGDADAYGDELSRPYSHRIQTEEDPSLRSASSWSPDPSREPSSPLGGDAAGDTASSRSGSGFDRAEPAPRPEPGGDPVPGTGGGPDGGFGTGSGNTWAFNRDDTRLPEDVRQAVEEQRRKRRDGSPEHTTAGFSRGEDTGGFPDRPEAAPGGTPPAPPPASDLGDDPLAAIAAQQARARAADGSAGDSAPAADEPGPHVRGSGGAFPGDELGPDLRSDLRGSGGSSSGDELGPDLRDSGGSSSGDELGPDLRGGESASSREGAADRGGQYGEPGAYGSYAAEPYGRHDEYGRPQSAEGYGEYAEYGEYGRGGPEGPPAAGHGAVAGGYGSYEPQGRPPGGYGVGDGRGPSGPEVPDPFAQAHPEYYTDRRGPQARQDAFAGETGTAYAAPGNPDAPPADHPRPGGAGADGPDTAAMDLPGLGSYAEDADAYGSAPRGGSYAGGYGPEPAADGAGAYGPGGREAAPEDAYAGYDEQDRRARSSRDPIREEFPDFDRPLGGTAGDDYPGYDNIDHWPDTAPEASATLWLGISALVPVIGLLTGIAALVMGSRANRAIRRSQEELEGLNLVRLGTILGWVGIGLSLLEIAVYAGGFVLS